jgi:hypothetical protein
MHHLVVNLLTIQYQDLNYRLSKNKAMGPEFQNTQVRFSR